MKKLLGYLLALSVFGLLFRLALIFSGPIENLGGKVDYWFMVDDSYYSFDIARSVARGDGWRTNGGIETSGFQPLYTFALVPIYWFADKNDKTTPIYAAFVLLAIFNAGASIWLGLIIWHFTKKRWLACLGAGAFLFSPSLIGFGVNGLETSMALFFIGATIWYYLQYRGAAILVWKRIVTLGFLLGVGLWARLDTAILAIALGIDILNEASKKGLIRGALIRSLVLATITVGSYSPFMIMSHQKTGNWLPESGPAVRQNALLNHAPLPELLFRYQISNLEKALAVSIGVPVLPNVRMMTGKFQEDADWVEPSLLINGLLLFFFAAMLWRRREKNQGGKNNFDGLKPLGLYMLFMILIYSLYQFADLFFARYLYPNTFLGLALILIFVDIIPRPAIKLTILAIMMIVALINGGVEMNAMFQKTSSPKQFGTLQVGAKSVLNKFLKPGEKVGALTSGYFAYWNDREDFPVINLDGKVNGKAYRAIRDHHLAEYLRQESVRYIIESPETDAVLRQRGLKFHAIASWGDATIFSVEGNHL
jgi:hypothetical protein